MVVDHAAAARESHTLPPEKGLANTPVLLADALVAALGASEVSSWLDPCAGSGRLVEAAVRAGASPATILAIDLQPTSSALEELGVKQLPCTDFLEWSQRSDRRFDRIIANPPFVRLSELEASLRARAMEVTTNGVEVLRTANYWVPFLVAAIGLLKPGGSLGYILPAAWEYADYASELRDWCSESFGELDVHRVTAPMFEEVSDGCVMLIAKGFGRRSVRAPRLINHGNLRALAEAVTTPELRFATLGVVRESDSPLPEDQVRLGEVARIGIGAVIGDVRFFLLNESKRTELGLPRSSVRPILSKARHIVAAEITTKTWTELMRDEERIWLFDPLESDLSHPRVSNYLGLPSDDGGCRKEALHIRNRTPWYRVQIPSRFDGFVTGMSQTMPWIAMNHMPRLTASNTLYGVRFLEVDDPEERAGWCLSMLSSATAASRESLVRIYPQGLRKLEPRDFARLAVHRPRTVTGARARYREAIQLILAGQAMDAQALADDWLRL